MSRLIDAERFDVVTDTLPEGMDMESYVAGQQSILNMIYDAPTEVDLDVIHCKDCDCSEMVKKGRYYCDFLKRFVSDDWYCARGEKREE